MSSTSTPVAAVRPGSLAEEWSSAVYLGRRTEEAWLAAWRSEGPTINGYRAEPEPMTLYRVTSPQSRPAGMAWSPLRSFVRAAIPLLRKSQGVGVELHVWRIDPPYDDALLLAEIDLLDHIAHSWEYVVDPARLPELVDVTAEFTT